MDSVAKSRPPITIERRRQYKLEPSLEGAGAWTWVGQLSLAEAHRSQGAQQECERKACDDEEAANQTSKVALWTAEERGERREPQEMGKEPTTHDAIRYLADDRFLAAGHFPETTP